MRLAVIASTLVISACAGRSHFRPPPLPELVANVRPTAPITATELALFGGERMIWDVQAKGFSIARAELTVGDSEVTSRVETGVLASTVTSLRHELATSLDREHLRPFRAHEVLVLEGKSSTIDEVFDEKGYLILGQSPVTLAGVHTIHTALGLLRAWVSPEARAGVIPILVGGQLYRLEVAQPTLTELSGTAMFKVEGRIASLGSVNLWLTTTDDHTPVRIEITTGDGKLTAELIERTETH